MNHWSGYLGAAALVLGGAMLYAPKAPEEPRPQVVAEVTPPPPPAADPTKPGGGAAPSGG
mgnify:CR=1 FL=1